MTKKDNKNNWIYSFIYFFRQSTKLLSLKFKNINSATFGGNLDPFYLFGIYNFKKILCSNKKIREFLLFSLPILFISVIQFVFIKNINYTKFFVNIFKIMICISIMLYVKDKNIKINLVDICKKVTFLLVIFTIIAFLFKESSIFWRLNDYTNIYDLRRLQLFYLEPSELGFHISILLILLFSFLLSKKDNKKSIYFLLIINIIILYFSKSMGAILLLLISLIVMMITNIIFNGSRQNIKKYLNIGFVGLIGIVIFLNSNIGMANRIKQTLAGKDGSVNYRVNVSLEVLNKSLKDYDYMGCGFGNLNTIDFISQYQDFKLAQMVVNSYIYFWIETGILGIIYWLILIFYIAKKCIKSKSIIKIGLFTYILLFQFVGSHFTNGLIWLIYGFIISSEDSKIIQEY